MPATEPPGGDLAIGLIGVGGWGRHILRDLKTLGCRVHAVARSAESVDRANCGGADVIAGGLEQLSADLDGIVIATPTATHLDLLEALLPRGRPIFVEKPCGTDPARVRGLLPLARGRAFVMNKWRYHPGVEALARIARGAEFGPVEAMRLSRLGWGLPHDDCDASWHLLPHDLSIVLHVLGGIPPPVWACRHPLGRLDGSVMALLRQPHSGVEIFIEAACGNPQHSRECVLLCRDGGAELSDGYADKLLIRRSRTADALIEQRPIATDLPLFRELEAFVGHLKGGPPPLTPFEEDLLIVDTIAAIRTLAGLDGLM